MKNHPEIHCMIDVPTESLTIFTIQTLFYEKHLCQDTANCSNATIQG